jgi:hypothetical protein
MQQLNGAYYAWPTRCPEPKHGTEVAAGAEQRWQMGDGDEMLRVAETNDKDA